MHYLLLKQGLIPSIAELVSGAEHKFCARHVHALSFNSFILDARSKEIVSMLDDISKNIMHRIHEKRDLGNN